MVSGSAGSHTCSLVAGAGDADNAAFTLAGSQLRTARPFDFAAKGTYSVLTRGGRTLSAAGTTAADAFSFAADPGGGPHALVPNGVHLAVDAAAVDAVGFAGNGGADAAVLSAAAGGDDLSAGGPSATPA